jgi:hypothetical protein
LPGDRFGVERVRIYVVVTQLVTHTKPLEDASPVGRNQGSGLSGISTSGWQHSLLLVVNRRVGRLFASGSVTLPTRVMDLPSALIVRTAEPTDFPPRFNWAVVLSPIPFLSDTASQ